MSAQVVLQNYMFERFLERLSKSVFSNNFILKGGMLIAALVDIANRSTMDMGFRCQSPQNLPKIQTPILYTCRHDYY